MGDDFSFGFGFGNTRIDLLLNGEGEWWERRKQSASVLEWWLLNGKVIEQLIARTRNESK